ncbi:MAG: hypothetical protein QXH08_02520 [Candidatus Hadarchaeales archaeon]
MTTALVYSPKYLEHRPGWGHPERPSTGRDGGTLSARRGLRRLWQL